MELLERIADQMASARLPLVGVTIAAVPCPDTPVIMTLHWHGFVKETLAEEESAAAVRLTAVPSSSLQVNERWDDLLLVDLAAMEAGWELGAWDVARAERPGCMRPGASSREAIECMQAFGSYLHDWQGHDVSISDAPDAEDLIRVAGRSGYLTWSFRPVHGGIWREVANDATLGADGTREPPCPHAPVRPWCDRPRRTVYRFGEPADRSILV